MQISPALASPSRAASAAVGTMRESWFGRLQPSRNVFLGKRVGPAAGWSSITDAVDAVRHLQPELGRGHDPSDATGSAVAILRDGARFTARFLLKDDGQDIRLWHMPTELTPSDPCWVATASGPWAP